MTFRTFAVALSALALWLFVASCSEEEGGTAVEPQAAAPELATTALGGTASGQRDAALEQGEPASDGEDAPLPVPLVSAPDALAEVQASYDAYQIGDWEEAYVRANAGVSSGGLSRADLAAAFAFRGSARRQLGDFEGSVEDFGVAVELGLPREFAASVVEQRGLAQWGMQQFEQAVESFEEALLLNPALASAANHRGIAYLAYVPDEDLYLALDSFTLALELDQDNAVFMSNRGRTYLGLQYYEEAITDFDAALAMDPLYPQTILSLRARAWEGLGDREAARADWVRVQELDPNESEYWDKFQEYGLLR